MIGLATSSADDLTLAKRRDAWQRMLSIAVGSLLFRCSLPVIPSFLPTANQGFCGEPGFDG
jgi:hypothetical protein